MAVHNKFDSYTTPRTCTLSVEEVSLREGTFVGAALQGT